MSENEDDKPTTVIDLKALKREKEEKERKLEEIGYDLEFNVKPGARAAAPATAQPQAMPSALPPVVLFDFGKGHFAAQPMPPGPHYHQVEALPELNAWLKKKVPFVLVFPLDVHPSGVNQLCAQLKAKFPHVTVVLLSKHFTPEKVAIHQASPAQAGHYLKLPFSAADWVRVLQQVTGKKAG